MQVLKYRKLKHKTKNQNSLILPRRSANDWMVDINENDSCKNNAREIFSGAAFVI